jgi:DNA-binding transcriptional MerR regulator
LKTAMLTSLAAKTRVPYRTLARWVEDGIVKPEKRTGRPGVDIVLSEKNILELENLIRLRSGGLSLQRARALMEDLEAQGYNPLSRGRFIVVDRKRGRVVRIGADRRTAREVAGPHKGQYVMIELLLDPMPPASR